MGPAQKSEKRMTTDIIKSLKYQKMTAGGKSTAYISLHHVANLWAGSRPAAFCVGLVMLSNEGTVLRLTPILVVVGCLAGDVLVREITVIITWNYC